MNIPVKKSWIKGLLSVLYAGIIIIAAYLVLWRAAPLLIQQSALLSSVEILPTSDRRYNLGFLIAFILIAPAVLLALSKERHNIDPARKKSDFSWAVLGAGLQFIVYPVINLLQGSGRISAAKAMGLTEPEHFIYYVFFTAWVIDGFREELYYRGFVQSFTGKVISGPGRILVPGLFFAFSHININDNIAGWLAGSLPHIIPGLLFGFLVIASDSLAPAMAAHGAGNMVITGLTAISIFAPNLYIVSVVFIIVLGCAALFFEKGKLAALWECVRRESNIGSKSELIKSLLLTIMLTSGYLLIVKLLPSPYISKY